MPSAEAPRSRLRLRPQQPLGRRRTMLWRTKAPAEQEGRTAPARIPSVLPTELQRAAGI